MTHPMALHEILKVWKVDFIEQQAQFLYYKLSVSYMLHLSKFFSERLLQDS